MVGIQLSRSRVVFCRGHRNLQWWPSTQVFNLLHPVSLQREGSLPPHAHWDSASNHLVQEVRTPKKMIEENFG